MHFNIYFLLGIFFSFLVINLYISGILLPNVLFIFKFKNLEINLIASFINKSELILLLHILTNNSSKLPIVGDLYSHLLHI